MAPISPNISTTMSFDQMLSDYARQQVDGDKNGMKDTLARMEAMAIGSGNGELLGKIRELRDVSSKQTLPLNKDQQLFANLKGAWTQIYGEPASWPKKLNQVTETLRQNVGLGSMQSAVTRSLQLLRTKDETVPALNTALQIIGQYSKYSHIVPEINAAMASGFWKEDAARAGLHFARDPLTLAVPIAVGGQVGRGLASLMTRYARVAEASGEAIAGLQSVFGLIGETVGFVGTARTIQTARNQPVDWSLEGTVGELAGSLGFFGSLKIFGATARGFASVMPTTESGMAWSTLYSHFSSIFGLASTEKLQAVAGIAPETSETFWGGLQRAFFLHGILSTAGRTMNVEGVKDEFAPVQKRADDLLEKGSVILSSSFQPRPLMVSVQGQFDVSLKVLLMSEKVVGEQKRPVKEADSTSKSSSRLAGPKKSPEASDEEVGRVKSLYMMWKVESIRKKIAKKLAKISQTLQNAYEGLPLDLIIKLCSLGAKKKEIVSALTKMCQKAGLNGMESAMEGACEMTDKLIALNRSKDEILKLITELAEVSWSDVVHAYAVVPSLIRESVPPQRIIDIYKKAKNVRLNEYNYKTLSIVITEQGADFALSLLELADKNSSLALNFYPLFKTDKFSKQEILEYVKRAVAKDYKTAQLLQGELESAGFTAVQIKTVLLNQLNHKEMLGSDAFVALIRSMIVDRISATTVVDVISSLDNLPESTASAAAEYLEGGHSLEQFREDFESLRDQVKEDALAAWPIVAAARRNVFGLNPALGMARDIKQQTGGEISSAYTAAAQAIAKKWSQRKIDKMVTDVVSASDLQRKLAFTVAGRLIAKDYTPELVVGMLHYIGELTGKDNSGGYRIVLALLSRGIDIKGATNYLVKFNNCLAEKFQGKINGQNGENTVTVITFENGEEISLSEFKNQVIQRVFSKAEVYESVATFIELGLTGEMALELFATILDAYLKDRAAATIDMYFFTHLTSKYFVELHEGKYGLQNSRSLVKALAEKGFNTEQIFRVMRGTAENSLCAVFHVYEKLPKLITTLLEGGEIDAEGVADILAHTGGSAAITVDLETVYEALPSLVKLSFKWLIKDGYSYSGAMDVIGNMVRHAKTFYTEKTETGEQVWNVWRLAQSYSSSFPSAFASGGSGPPTWNPDSFYANVLISWLEKPNGFYLLKDGVPLMKDEQAVRANPSRFTQILKKLPPYSQLAFMRYLKLRFPEEELTLEKAETARLKFQKTIDDYKGKIVTDADTEFILFANGEERFNLQLAKEFFLTFGGKNENIVAEGLKGPEAKDQILELVAGEPGRSNGTRRTFIMYLGHGDKEYLSLGQGDPVSASKEKTRIDFAEFGEALLSRSTVYSGDLSSVIIYTDACYSYNFIRNLENFLRGKGVKTLPIVITSSNLDSLGTGGSSEMDSVYLSMILRKFAGKVRALRLLHFLETDVDPSVKTVEDPTIFVPDPDKPDRYIEIG